MGTGRNMGLSSLLQEAARGVKSNSRRMMTSIPGRDTLMAKAALVLMAVMLLALAGCAASPSAEATTGGLSVAQMTTAMGGDSPSEQRLSYSITLVNSSANEIVIEDLEPVLAGQIANRSLVGNAAVQVGKTIRPRESLTITGEVSFDARGASKEEIAGWGPAILGARVGSQLELRVP